MSRLASTLVACSLAAIGPAYLNGAAQAQSGEAIRFDSPTAELDELVETCLATEGVYRIEGSDSICYNAAIFPREFLSLSEMDPADQIIVTSPGGNVATARIMSGILDGRGEPVVFAGQCMSACAMVLLPGADDIRIHRSAHFAVHGIVMMPFKQWYAWTHDGEEPSRAAALQAGFGYDFAYTMYQSGRDHMKGHLAAQNVDMDYIAEVSKRMLDSARQEDCRVAPDNYWGMLDAEYLQKYLGDRITYMEEFIQSWDDPNNNVYKDITVPIAPQTYIFEDDYLTAGCT